MIGSKRASRTAVLFGLVVLAAGASTPVVGGPPAQVTANASVIEGAGAGFAGAVGGEGAALETEQRRRTQNVSLARTDTPAGRANLVAVHEAALDGRLDTLEARSMRLSHALRTGRMERDRYRAEKRVLAVEIAGIERRIELLDRTLTRLPGRVRTAALTNDLDRLAERTRALLDGDDDDDDDGPNDDDTDDDDDGIDRVRPPRRT